MGGERRDSVGCFSALEGPGQSRILPVSDTFVGRLS
jgi:hypothetical protein